MNTELQLPDLRIGALLHNSVFLSIVFSLLIAQLIKSILVLLKRKSEPIGTVLLTFFWKTGGMPSSHSAMAVSVTTAIALTEGFTTVFVLALYMALVVIRDALGVRRSAGVQARTLNRLGNEVAAKLNISFKSVKEIHGHTPAEVAVGSLLGFFIAIAFCTL